MSTRDIEAHLLEVYGVKASRELVSNITDVVTDEIEIWRNRPVDEVYPIVYIDGIRIKVRDKGAVTIKVAHLAMGVDVDGRKHALGLLDRRGRGREVLALGAHPAAQPRAARHPDRLLRRPDRAARGHHQRFPGHDRANVRGARDAQCDAVRVLSGPEEDRRQHADDLHRAQPRGRRVALKDLDTEWGRQYPGVIDVWRRAWNEFIPFLDYPAELRRMVYTTNAIESINFQLRKVTKTRGHFPSDEAAMKLLYLGLRNISSKRGGESGTGTWGWKMALNTLVVLFPGRLPL